MNKEEIVELLREAANSLDLSNDGLGNESLIIRLRRVANRIEDEPEDTSTLPAVTE